MQNIRRILLIAMLAVAAPVVGDDTSIWHVTLNSQHLGPVEFHLEIAADGSGIRGRSLSGATAILGQLPGERRIATGLMAFAASTTDDGSHEGRITAPWQDGSIKLTFSADSLEGRVDDGIFSGAFSGRRVAAAGRLRDYPAILDAFDDVVATKVYAPADLDEPGYRDFRRRLAEVVEAATDDLDLLFGFRWLWQNDPFSHFQLRRSPQTAAEMFAMFDNYRVGFEAATVEFDGDVALLTVRTMMGADTIEQIEAAYDRIAEQQPGALIIDLRGNGGGAFAVKPLVEHVIDEPLDAGFFISQVWNRKHDDLPDRAAVLSSAPWEGWSIIAFWEAVQDSDILRIRFQPAEPNFDGEVVVLIDERSASATELAADALRASGLATLVGQRSAGEMLSQSMFDVADGFIVSLPVADYYSVAHGRIEGTGVPVDVDAEAGQALEAARALLQNRRSGVN